MPLDATLVLALLGARVMGFVGTLAVARPFPIPWTALAGLFAALVWALAAPQLGAEGSSILVDLPHASPIGIWSVVSVLWPILLREISFGVLVGVAVAIPGWAVQWSFSSVEWIISGEHDNGVATMRARAGALTVIMGSLWVLLLLDLLPGVIVILGRFGVGKPFEGDPHQQLQWVLAWGSFGWALAVELLLPFLLVIAVVTLFLVLAVHLLGSVWHGESARALAFPLVLLVLAQIWPGLTRELRTVMDERLAASIPTAQPLHSPAPQPGPIAPQP